MFCDGEELVTCGHKAMGMIAREKVWEGNLEIGPPHNLLWRLCI